MRHINKNSIHFLILDVDGTLTDGKIYMSEQGELVKTFHIKDGYAIHDMLPKAGVTPIVLTGRSSKIVANRCEELGITMIFQGIRDKSKALDEIVSLLSKNSDKEDTLKNIAYMGDDLNDLTCMQRIIQAGGIVGCPADAANQICHCADFISTKNGGDGAVREFVEWLLADS